MEGETAKEKDMKFLTVPEVAELLHCTERTVWRMIREGKLKAIMPAGRRLILESALQELVETELAKSA